MVVDLKEVSTIDIISYALSKQYTDKQLQKLELGGTTLTPESIVNTLGYTPADDVKVAMLSEEKADKAYMVALFEELKALIQGGDIDGAIALLDRAILDNSVLA